MVSNTDSLVYDLNTHKYYITSNGFSGRFGLHLDEELGSNQVSGITEEEVFIKQVSDRVYRWLYWYIRPENIRITEKRIADDFIGEDYGIPYREAIEEALYAQAEWMINFDGDMEALANDEITKMVSVEVKQILMASGMAHKMRMGVRVNSDEWRVGY